MGTSCYFIGHREAGKDVFPLQVEAVEKHITEYGVTDFYVGHYGGFDRLAAQAVDEGLLDWDEPIKNHIPEFHPV